MEATVAYHDRIGTNVTRAEASESFEVRSETIVTKAERNDSRMRTESSLKVGRCFVATISPLNELESVKATVAELAMGPQRWNVAVNDFCDVRNRELRVPRDRRDESTHQARRLCRDQEPEHILLARSEAQPCAKPSRRHVLCLLFNLLAEGTLDRFTGPVVRARGRSHSLFENGCHERST